MALRIRKNKENNRFSTKNKKHLMDNYILLDVLSLNLNIFFLHM